jgi:hypothetical protein
MGYDAVFLDSLPTFRTIVVPLGSVDRLLDPDNGGTTFLRNVGNCSRNDTVSHPR